MSNLPDDIPVVDHEELIDHIEDELIKAGYAPEREAIVAVLEAEQDFLMRKGILYEVDDE